MVEGPGPNGRKPHLRAINGGKQPDGPKQRHLFWEVEPLVQEALRDIRKDRAEEGRLIGFMEKIMALRLLALAMDEVGGDAMPILREATVVADSAPDRLLAARLMMQVADSFRDVGMDAWPVMDMAFTCAQQAPGGREKEELLVDIAYAYCVLGDFPRAERIMGMLTYFGLREELKKAIEELISSQPKE